MKGWCPETESNCRHGDFQSPALPTELPGHKSVAVYAEGRVFKRRMARKSSTEAHYSLGLEVRRGLGTIAEEEFFHLLFEEGARLGVDRAETVFVE